MTNSMNADAHDFRDDFSYFRSRHDGRAHFAAHSHHFWPDVTREAHLRCWDDASRLSDEKWDYVLGTLWEQVRCGIAQHLHLPDPNSLALAPNTHELLMRLLSCLTVDRPPRVLTTDGEFHSFRRQCARLAEEGLLEPVIVEVEPVESFTRRFIDAARTNDSLDLVYFSQVFFDSGFANDDLDGLVDDLWRADRLLVIDGYHGFLARPTRLRAIADRAFYLAGGYKYAMAGEGICFMHCPPGIAMRPRNTGWYAQFGALAAQQDQVGYATDGGRFMGATFDPSGLYRLQASLEWLAGHGLDASRIHAHARALQRQFVGGLRNVTPTPFEETNLVVPADHQAVSNFLTYRCADAEPWMKRLRAADIIIDRRGDRLRVGFGLYQNAQDVEGFLDRLSALPRS